MTQHLRPTSTVTAGGWTTPTSASLHAAINEGIDNADDAASYDENLNENDDLEVALSAGTDPLTDTLHVIYWRAKRSGVYFTSMSTQVQLYQGATLIATGTGSHGLNYSTASYTLTSAETNAITDYTDLRLRLRYTNNMGAAHIHLTTAELSIPSIDVKTSARSSISAPEVLGQVAQPIARGQSVEVC